MQPISSTEIHDSSPEDPRPGARDSASQCPDAVLLIHGTYAHEVEDEGLHWWQLTSEVSRHIDVLLGGRPQCWPEDACAAFPWAASPRRPPKGQDQPGKRLDRRQVRGPEFLTVGCRLFAWEDRNSDLRRREAGRRLYEGFDCASKGWAGRTI